MENQIILDADTIIKIISGIVGLFTIILSYYIKQYHKVLELNSLCSAELKLIKSIDKYPDQLHQMIEQIEKANKSSQEQSKGKL